jgi:hypothetical protein
MKKTEKEKLVHVVTKIASEWACTKVIDVADLKKLCKLLNLKY